jgi:hypothetical protein
MKLSKANSKERHESELRILIKNFENVIRNQERARMIKKYNIRDGESNEVHIPLKSHKSLVSDARDDIITYSIMNSHLNK